MLVFGNTLPATHERKNVQEVPRTQQRVCKVKSRRDFTWKEGNIKLRPCLRVCGHAAPTRATAAPNAHNTLTGGGAHSGHEGIRERAKTPPKL